MKTYEEIKDIIVNKLGITNQETYKAWTTPLHEEDPEKRRIITQEDIDLLSPDNIDNNAFWRVAEEIFGVDPVCFTNYGKSEVSNPDVGNMRNLALARTTGMLSYVDEWRHSNNPLVEIGAGYGSFKRYCQVTTAFGYMGFDTYPKAPGVYPTDKDGSFPRSFVENYKGKINVVFSSNVFQHLSRKQRSQYFKDIHEILSKECLFVFNLLVHYADPATVTDKDRYAYDGRRYLCHYGQFTEIPFYPELKNELEQYFTIIGEYRRYHDYFFTFNCAKKELTPPQVTATV